MARETTLKDIIALLFLTIADEYVKELVDLAVERTEREPVCS